MFGNLFNNNLVLWVIIGVVIVILVINKIRVIKSKFFIIIFGIFISVIVYYLNYFSGVLGNKGALPIYLSIWTPLFILFLFCNIGMLKVNEN